MPRRVLFQMSFFVTISAKSWTPKRCLRVYVHSYYLKVIPMLSSGYVCSHTLIHARKHTYTFIDTHIQIHIYTHIQTYAKTCIHTNSRAHTRIHTCIHGWRCLWCDGYRQRKWTRWHEFKSWLRLTAFHIALIPLGKILIQLFSLQIWVVSRADRVLSQPVYEKENSESKAFKSR